MNNKFRGNESNNLKINFFFILNLDMSKVKYDKLETKNIEASNAIMSGRMFVANKIKSTLDECCLGPTFF